MTALWVCGKLGPLHVNVNTGRHTTPVCPWKWGHDGACLFDRRFR